jgi:hypothetical protein
MIQGTKQKPFLHLLSFVLSSQNFSSFTFYPSSSFPSLLPYSSSVIFCFFLFLLLQFIIFSPLLLFLVSSSSPHVLANFFCMFPFYLLLLFLLPFIFCLPAFLFILFTFFLLPFFAFFSYSAPHSLTSPVPSSLPSFRFSSSSSSFISSSLFPFIPPFSHYSHFS